MARLRSGTRNSSVQRARELRKARSASEEILWSFLAERRLGFRFRSQHPVLGYFLDFYCPAAKLCVEIDGEQHKEQEVYDRARDEELARIGVMTLRFPSLDIFTAGTEFDRMIDAIYEACCERTGTKPERVR